MPKIWLKNVRVHERLEWPRDHVSHPVREAVGPTARDPLWSREAHAPPTGWVTWPSLIGPENSSLSSF